VPRGAVAVAGERIAWVGPESELAAEVRIGRDTAVLDAKATFGGYLQYPMRTPKELVPYLGDPLAACLDDYKALNLWNANPVMKPEGLEWLRDAMHAAGYIRSKPAYEQCVDMRYAGQAVREDPPSP